LRPADAFQGLFPTIGNDGSGVLDFARRSSPVLKPECLLLAQWITPAIPSLAHLQLTRLLSYSRGWGSESDTSRVPEMNKAAKHGPHHRSAAEGSPASGARSGGGAPPDRARVDSKAAPLSDSTSALARNPFNLDAEAAVKLAYDLIAPHVQHIKKNTPFNLMYAGYSKDGTFVADYDESRLSLAAWDAVENLSDEEMPGYLREFVCSVLWEISRGRRPLRRKRGKPSNYLADMGLSVVATTVAHRFGLKLTRGDATRDLNRAESACSIVQKALERHGINMGETTIQVAVNRYRRRPAQAARRY
jgi:hypothetical protein